MGKGSNVQKAQAARERNAKKMGKSDEERKAASDKAKKDSVAKQCAICLQTFMVNSRPPLLHQHIVAKHPELTPSDYRQCFPNGELDDYDPDDPKGEKAAAKAKVDADKAKAKAKKEAAAAGLDLLLDSGLKKGKK